MENTQLAIDLVKTFLSREDQVDQIQTSKVLVELTTAPPDIMQQLAVLQVKVTAFEAGQSGFSVCGGGLGRGRRTPEGTTGGFLNNFPKSGGNHDDIVCFRFGDELEAKGTEMKKTDRGNRATDRRHLIQEEESAQ